MAAATAPALAPTPEAAKPDLVARLRARKEERSGTVTFKLPETGVEVTYPRFREYRAWAKAQQLGAGSMDRVQIYYILQLCHFDGERLRLADYEDLIPAPDHLALAAKVLGGGEDEKPAADNDVADPGN